MSILINGMEMPKTPVLFCVHPDGKVFADLEGNWREYKAVPVPEHGRLIDADALEASCFMGSSSFYTQSDIDYAPTIIPAKDGET